MQAVEPIKFELEGPGIKLDDSFDGPDIGGWDETHTFFLHKVIGEYFDIIDSKHYYDCFLEVIGEELAPIGKVLDFEGTEVSRPYRFAFPGPSPIYLRESTFAVPNKGMNGVIYIISNNNNEARNLRDNLIQDLKAEADRFAGAGIKGIEVSSKQEFTRDMLFGNSAITEIESKEPDEFEEEVYGLLNPLSEAFANNLVINFGSHPQNREYDILFATTPSDILHISLKNYAGVEDTPTKEDIISDPRDIASLLGADMTISVVHGIEDDERMGSFRREAELRDEIEICGKEDCLQKVKDYVEKTMMPPLIESSGINMYFG